MSQAKSKEKLLRGEHCDGFCQPVGGKAQRLHYGVIHNGIISLIYKNFA